MKALTIRQPWAWAILHAGKDVENRSWKTDYRGRLLIHAASNMTRREYEDAKSYILDRFSYIPNYDEFDLGAIVGCVELCGCYQFRETVDTPWFEGEWGWLLKHPVSITPIPFKGQQRLWEYNGPISI